MNPSRRAPVILMADDDADDRLLVKEALEECGVEHELHFAEDGLDLLDYLTHRGDHQDRQRAPRPQLILLDLNMPLKDGREVLQDIRADEAMRSIPVVVFTTSKADTDIRQMYDLGANSFITKPAAFADLVDMMRKVADYWFGVVHISDPRPQSL